MRSAIWIISIHHLLKEVVIHCFNIATAAIDIAGCPIVPISICQTASSCPIASLTRIRDWGFSRLIILVIIKFTRHFSSKRYYWLWFIIWLSDLIWAWSIDIGNTITLICSFPFPRLQRRICRALSSWQIDPRRSEWSLSIFAHSWIELQLTLFVFFVVIGRRRILKGASATSSLAYGSNWLDLIGTLVYAVETVQSIQWWTHDIVKWILMRNSLLVCLLACLSRGWYHQGWCQIWIDIMGLRRDPISQQSSVLYARCSHALEILRYVSEIFVL